MSTNEPIPIQVGLALLAIGVGLTASALITGKAMNPLRGFSPFIVTRDKEPARYWASVAMNLIPILVGSVFLWSDFSN